MVRSRSRITVAEACSGAGAGLSALTCLALACLALASCASKPLAPMPVASRPVCTDVVFPIYFAEGSDQLTPTANQVIGSEAVQVHGCRIGYVSVLGLTDAA